MHHLIATFFAFVFALSHSTPASRVEVETAAPVTQVAEYTPTRQEIAQAQFVNSYAVTACVSCRRTNVTYRTR